MFRRQALKKKKAAKVATYNVTLNLGSSVATGTTEFEKAIEQFKKRMTKSEAFTRPHRDRH